MWRGWCGCSDWQTCVPTPARRVLRSQIDADVSSLNIPLCVWHWFVCLYCLYIQSWICTAFCRYISERQWLALILLSLSGVCCRYRKYYQQIKCTLRMCYCRISSVMAMFSIKKHSSINKTHLSFIVDALYCNCIFDPIYSKRLWYELKEQNWSCRNTPLC